MTKLLFEYTKLLRLPGLGGLSLAPIFGALSVYGLDEIIDLKMITLLLILGIFKSIFGFVQNDYADIELDKLSEETKTRPLVTGTISKKIAVIICLICLIGTFFIVFAFFYKNEITFFIAVILILVSLFIGSIYNYFGKKFSTSAFIAALADAFYVLIGAYLVSSIIELSIFTWIIFGLVYTQFLFMTIIAGGVKDADHDYLYNVKNFAIKCGVKITKDKKIIIPLIFKIFAMSIRIFSGFLVFVPFIFFNIDYELWYIILLAFFVIIVLILSALMLNVKSFEKMDEVTKLAGLQGILRFCFVPLLLIPIIGYVYVILLILFPIIWYIIFTPFTGKKLFKNLM